MKILRMTIRLDNETEANEVARLIADEGLERVILTVGGFSADEVVIEETAEIA